MKKAMVYILALTLAFSTMLAGCGEKRGTDGGTVAPTATPAVTEVPGTMMPDPADGVVEDRDGIITERDNGKATDDKRTDGGTVPGVTASGQR